jgi:hypothetical protein
MAIRISLLPHPRDVSAKEAAWAARVAPRARSARSGREHDDVVTLVRLFPRERVDDQLLAADCRQRRFGVKANSHCKPIGSGAPVKRL